MHNLNCRQLLNKNNKNTYLGSHFCYYFWHQLIHGCIYFLVKNNIAFKCCFESFGSILLFQYLILLFQDSNNNIKLHMSSNKNPLKSSSHSGSKSSFFKANEAEMLLTHYSSFSGQRDDDFDRQSDLIFQEECLTKLKEQRQKIEELTYLYQKTQEQMKKQQQKVKRFQVQMVSLEQLKDMKVKYIALSKQFQQLMGENSIAQNQNQQLRQKLSELSKQHQRILKLTAYQRIKLKQQNNQQKYRYEQAIKDKDDQITRNLNIYEIKENEYSQSIHNLQQVVKQMENQMNQIKRRNEVDTNDLTSEIIKRDASLEKMKSAVDNVKEENSTLRTQLKHLQNHFLAKQQQWLQSQDQFLFEINSSRRKLNDSEHRLAQYKYSNQRLEQKLHQSSTSMLNLKESLKTLQQQSTISLNQLACSYEQKTSQYKYQIDELKDSVQELLEVKNIYSKQNQILKDKIMRDEENKKRRRQVMKSELREIEKIQNSVRRVV